MGGRWHIEVVLRRAGFDDVQHTFEVDIVRGAPFVICSRVFRLRGGRLGAGRGVLIGGITCGAARPAPAAGAAWPGTLV